jgi:hypothetical protein
MHVISWPSEAPWFCHCSNIWRCLQIMKLHIIQFFPRHCYFLRLRADILLSAPSSSTLSPWISTTSCCLTSSSKSFRGGLFAYALHAVIERNGNFGGENGFKSTCLVNWDGQRQMLLQEVLRRTFRSLHAGYLIRHGPYVFFAEGRFLPSRCLATIGHTDTQRTNVD